MKSKSIFSNLNKTVKKLTKGDILDSAVAFGTAVYGISENIYEGNKNMQAERQKQKEEQAIYERAYNRISGMLPITNNKIFFSCIKTTFTKDNNMTQYIRFYLFNDMKMEIEDITLDIHLLSGKIFNVNLKHGDLQNTMKLENTDFMYLQDQIKKVFGTVSFKTL